MLHTVRSLALAACLTAALVGGALGSDGEGERPAYRIGVEDVLEINVWKAADVSRQVWVRPDGRITVPLAGELYAKGLTLAQVTEVLQERFKEYFTEPLVTVTLLESNSYNVYLLGRVKTPGVMKLRSPRTFLQVLAMAGGFAEFASSDKVSVMRWDGAESKKLPVDVEQVLKGRQPDFLLQPGDVVVVP